MEEDVGIIIGVCVWRGFLYTIAHLGLQEAQTL
jgi:hypothetical protein